MLPRTTTSCRTCKVVPAIVFLSNHWMQTRMSWQNMMFNSFGVWPGTPEWNSHTEKSHIPDEGRYLTATCWWRDIKGGWEIMAQHFPYNSVCQWNRDPLVQRHTQPVLLLGESAIWPFPKSLFFFYKVNITSKPWEVNRIWNTIKCLWGDFKALTLPANLLIWDLGKLPTSSCTELKFTIYLRHG